MGENEIPVMDDPLGKHWDQPRDIRSAPMDEAHVILRPDQAVGLCNYDRTLPSGVYPGKCWRRRETKPDRDMLVWYGAETPDGKCPILMRDMLIIIPNPEA
jgi:hypothetical protein